jgi:hypothetical protein
VRTNPDLATLSALCLGRRSSLTETADMRKLEATIIYPVSSIGIREPSVSTTNLAHAAQRLTPPQRVRQPSLTARWRRTQEGRLEMQWRRAFGEAA